jgi:hypothetical protein
MKVELFKQSFEKYKCVFNKTSTPIQNKDFIYVNTEDVFGDLVNLNQPTKKHPLFVVEKATTDEESYIENYNNLMCDVTKSYVMVIIEKTEDKVSIKVFRGSRNRRAGNVWFKVSRNVDYITVNKKTGDVYHGYLHDYQKKRKCAKKIRRNFFFAEPINTIKNIIQNALSDYGVNTYEIAIRAVSTFMLEVDERDGFENLDFNKRLFRFYLNKRQVKYPNNFYVYTQILVGPEIRKILKKNNNKLVESYMIKEGLSGKKLKKALHNCDTLNIELYKHARILFGDDWLNQDEDVISKLLNSKLQCMIVPTEFKTFISPEELKRVYSIFKRVFIYDDLDSYTFYDHIRMYTELRLYGEDDLRWYSENSKEEFREEHLDWTEKIQFYKQGNYTRTYPEYFKEVIEKEIDGYTPVLLMDSNSYNEESMTQSNCVKTYIGKPSSFIVSLRKGLFGDRATLEYKLSKNGEYIIPIRVQSLGKFNGKLDEEWNDVLFKLDKVILSSIKDKRFETVKIIKECKNGVTLKSDTYWENDNLKWTYKNIETQHNWVLY